MKEMDMFDTVNKSNTIKIEETDKTIKIYLNDEEYDENVFIKYADIGESKGKNVTVFDKESRPIAFSKASKGKKINVDIEEDDLLGLEKI